MRKGIGGPSGYGTALHHGVPLGRPNSECLKDASPARALRITGGLPDDKLPPHKESKGYKSPTTR